MDLSSIHLLDLQPQSLRTDPTTIALCAAFNPVFQQLSDNVKLTMVYTNINSLTSVVLDELAWALHVDWYNAADPLPTRREMVKKSLAIHSRKGTASAVKDAVNAAFGDSYIEEWFQYAGQPYRFKIYIADPTATTSRALEFVKTVNSVKNERSVLELVVLIQSAPAPLYISAAAISAGTERCGVL